MKFGEIEEAGVYWWDRKIPRLRLEEPPDARDEPAEA
jgi:hypothetical protein